MPTKKTNAKKPAAAAAAAAPKRKAATKPKPAPAKAEAKSAPAAKAPEPAKPKPPRIPPFVNGDPIKEKTRVPLTPTDFTSKTHVMLEIAREKTNLEAEFEFTKADYKARIKEKAEEIINIQGILQSNSEEQEIAVYWRYFPKRRLKKKINAGTGKVMGQTLPMTPEEIKRHAQPALLDVPPTPKPETVPALNAKGEDGKVQIVTGATDANGMKDINFPPIEGESKKFGNAPAATHQDHANVGAGGGDEDDDIPEHLQD